MATVAFLSAFNLDDLDLWQGTITDIGATSITVLRGDLSRAARFEPQQ